MAQGTLQHIIEERGLESLIDEVDSCGTAAYHTGNAPDSRTLWTLKEHGITLDHSARQLEAADFDKFDYILAMDRENLAGIESVARKVKSGKKPRVCLFGEYGKGKSRVIQDPYYGPSNAGFDKAYEQSVEFSDGLIRAVQEKEGPAL
ncbi:phosphotyrosine protein phosphatase I superfamily [Protomyces lactucae-debilis]|uniref:Phosphotyrosine protein phosphatase I superfamily n=1 Tax=Protomyces lactucae-debilis TaxID=2754530 RepID=A0A1Y2FQX8_PROLT|nr:phosphotyrosine protein phosphatase I superfamily [Protomyces lactucae-debilis]ORY86401.1 phosphotyrosine protein phosphatase I superfamily [Protomyces lactucae-debilis]